MYSHRSWVALPHAPVLVPLTSHADHQSKRLERADRCGETDQTVSSGCALLMLTSAVSAVSRKCETFRSLHLTG